MIRADRALSVYIFGPLGQIAGGQRDGIPILMYHRVPDEDNCKVHPYYCTTTSKKDFALQIACLKELGYRSVSPRETYQAAHMTSRSEKLVSITFDDGYRDFYTNAFPILSRFGLSATVYLPTAFIGNASRRFKGEECLNWSEIRELRRAGVEFGSHTVSHPQLSELSEARLNEELSASRCEIEQRLGEKIESFAYPYAFPEANHGFVASLRAQLLKSGYRYGVSTMIGRVNRSSNSLFMRRLPANSHDDRRFFEAKLLGGYDWLHHLQYAAKLRTSQPSVRSS